MAQRFRGVQMAGGGAGAVHGCVRVRGADDARDFRPNSAAFEQVALTLGCNRRQAFWRVIMPQAKGGLLAAGTLAWARALGEFGPILVFAGATRQKTEVLPTSAFLELQAGRTEGMLAVSLIMIAAAAVVFIVARTLGMKRIFA